MALNRRACSAGQVFLIKDEACLISSAARGPRGWLGAALLMLTVMLIG